MPRGKKTPLDKKYRIVRRIERGEIDIKTATEKAGIRKNDKEMAQKI